MELPGADLVALAEEMRLVVGGLHPTARAYMWWGIDQLIKPNSESLESILFRCDDFKLIGNAASLAIGILPKAGSYTDGSFGLAIQLLVQAYEIVTGRTATFSRTPFGAPSKNGTYSTKAGSECGRFVLAFFACVNAERGVTLPTSSLEKILSARRQQAI